MLREFVTSLAMRLMVFKGNSSLRHLEKASKDPMGENLALLKQIIRKNKNTEFGKKFDFSSISESMRW